MSNPFDYVNAILQNKKQIIVDELTEKDYVPFIVNRSLSYHSDCVMYANEVNRRHFLDKKLQNDFLLNTIRSRKRPFAKWVKSEKSADVDLIKLAYGLSDSKAIESLRLISEKDIKLLREKFDIGG
jgi:hypothetical protein